MNQRQYRAVTAFLRTTPLKQRAALAICKGLPILVFLLYCGGLVELVLALIGRGGGLSGLLKSMAKYLLMPLTGFCAVTLLRKHINAPRPYQKFDFVPLKPHSPGLSFPSRHTASAFLLAMACLRVNSILGVAAILAAVAVGATRVMAGLHYPRDVISGGIFAVTWGMIWL